jgi:protein O-GlcNAc transferase
MDYRITDALADPPGETEHLHSEKLLRLPCFLCYDPADGLPESGPPPCAKNGFVTFGSFNNFMKMSPGTIEAWARILRSVPGSRLVLKHLLSSDSRARQGIRGVFERHGVGRERIAILPWSEHHSRHLESWNQIDIALDPFRYNGTTSTCDALAMGVPVVALAGRAHVSRVGVTLLTHAGLDDWIACSVDDYVRRAVDFARSPDLLNEIRVGLRARMAASDLGNPVRFAGAMEDAYRRIWGDYCSSPG